MRSGACMLVLIVALALALSARAAPGATRGAIQEHLSASEEAPQHRFAHAKTRTPEEEARLEEALDCIAHFGPQKGVMFLIHAVARLTDGQGKTREKRFCTYNGSKKLTAAAVFEYVHSHACSHVPIVKDKTDVMCKAMPSQETEEGRDAYDKLAAKSAALGLQQVMLLATGRDWGSRNTCGEKKAAAVAFATAVDHVAQHLPDTVRDADQVTVDFSTLAIAAQTRVVQHCLVKPMNERVECLRETPGVVPSMPCGLDVRDNPEGCCHSCAQSTAEPFAKALAEVAGVAGDTITVNVRMELDHDAHSTYTAVKA